jgi:lipopolysaccharide/colanic/teichoic acid biosynthesis glycosyltransferase
MLYTKKLMKSKIDSKAMISAIIIPMLLTITLITCLTKIGNTIFKKIAHSHN